MDLKSLKRKELQALCKKHGIPANSTSSRMIESLSSILENHDKVKPKGCLNGSGGGSAEDLGVVGGNLKKKVSFVVEAEEDDEVEEITRSPVENSKKKSVANEVVGIERRSTRSRGLAEAVLWSPVIEKTSKKSMRVGTEGVRRNVKPILSDVLSTRSLRNRVVVAGGDEELVTDQNLRRTQKRSIAEKKVTSVIEDAADSEFEEITRNPVGNSKRESDVNNAVEIERRSTRSHGLAEAVLWSPVIEKTMKKRWRDGTEGVRRNDHPISNDVPTTRSLRNRVVIVGGEEESTNDLNWRRTQKRKFSVKKDENEMVASKLEGDKFVGRKNVRKRSRDGDFVGDEAPNRTCTHNHAKSEENMDDLEEVDVGRSMKRRKRDTDSLRSGEGVDEKIERANSTKAMVVNSNAVESENVNKAEGRKKVHSRVKTRASKRGVNTRASKRGGPTSLALDAQVVNLPARRSTRSSSLVGKLHEERRASKKGRSHKGGLLDTEVVAEPISRSKGASSTFQEDGVVEKSKSQKQAKGHGSKGGVSTTSLQDSETIAEPVGISTRSSLSLLENGSSLPVVEAVKEVKSQKQGKGRASKGQTVPLSDNEASPMRRSIRSSAKSLDDEAHLSEVGILSSDEEAIKNKKPGDQHRVHASKLGDPTVFLLENEAVTESQMRSTRGSRKLFGETSSPIVKGNMATGDHASKMDDHATALSARRSTHGSSKLSKVGSVPNIETFGSGNEVRTNKSGNKLKNFELVTSVPDNEPVTTPSTVFTQSSSKLLEARCFLEAVSKNKLGKKSRNSASKEGDPTAMVLGSPVVSESVRRSTRSHLKHISLEVETSSPVEGGKTRKDQRQDNLEGRGSEIRAQTKSLEEHGQSKELLRRSVQSSSKKNVLGGDKVEVSKSDGAISVSDPPAACISFDLSIDMGSGNAETEFTDAVGKNVHEIRQSPAKVEKGTSLMGSAKDLGDTCLGSPTNGNQSSGFELANKGSGELLLNVEGSADIEENVSKLFPVEPSTIEVNSELAAPSKISKEPSATFDTEISTMAHPKGPDSMVKVGVEHDNVITGYETIHVSSSQVPKSSKELSLRIDSHTSQGIDLEERLDAEICGAGEDDLGYYEETDIAVPTLVCKSSEELTLTVVPKADPENFLEEPNSKVECDGPCEDIVADNEAMNILGPLTSDTEVCSDSQTSQGADLEEPWLKPDICDANEDGLQDNEETDIVVRTSVCKSSEELLQTSVTVGNPEIDLKEPDSIVESDHPSEDVIGDDEGKKIFIPLTSDTEVRAENLCDINVVGSKVVVHDTSQGDMEQNDATTTVRSVMICKSTGISFPISLNEASPHSDLGQVDFPAMNKVASHSKGSLTEASGIRCKTLEDSGTVDGYPGDTSIPQTIFDNEMENCKANPDIVLKSHPEHGECDIVNNNEAVACDKYPQLYEDLEVMKETWASSTVSVTVNDGTEIDNDRKDDERNENELRSCLLMDGYAVEGTESSSEEIVDALTSDTEVCSDSHTSQGTDLDEPRLKPEICSATDNDLQDNEETDIGAQTSVCKSSEELTQTSVIVANPEIDLEEPDSKVEGDHPSEGIMGDDEEKEIFIPKTSDAEVCTETLCDINVVGSDSKVKVHDGSAGDMEQNEATTTISSVMSCKSTAILLPTSLNEACPHSDSGQVGISGMNKEASHSEGSLTEASAIRCKTLEVSMTVDGNPGDTCSPRTIFDNEMENCKVNPDIILKSPVENWECDMANNVEAVACYRYPQLHEDLEVMKETWVSSTVSVTVNDGTEIDNDRKDAEKNENEPRSSLPMEDRAVEGTQSSSEELVDAEQLDFTRSSYEKKSGDAEKKMSVSFNDEFSAENNDRLTSPVAFIKSEGTSCAARLERKDETSAFEIAEVSTKITEDEYSVEHRRSSQLFDANRESEKQMEDFRLCDVDEESKGHSASSNENTSLVDGVLFGDVKKLIDHGDLPTLPVTSTCGEEMPLRGTEAPTLSGDKGLTKQVAVQGFSFINDYEDERNLSDSQEVTVNMTENLGVNIMDRSSKSAAKKHVDVERLNVHSDLLPENSIIVNKLSDVEFERTTILGAVVSEEMDNIGSFVEGYDGTKADSIEPEKVDLLDDVGQKQDKAPPLQEIKHFSGELHTDENASHTLFNNSASGSAEDRALLAEKTSPSTCLKNAPRMPKVAIVLSREAQLEEDSSVKTSAEDDTWNSEEFVSTSNFVPLADQQECQDNNLEEHAVDIDIDMSVSGIDQYFGFLDDEALTEKSFHMNDEAAASMNENVEGGECEHCEENLGGGKYEDFSERDSTIALAVREDEVKGVVPGSCGAVVEELSPSECEIISVAENFASASPKTFGSPDPQEQNKQNAHDQVEDDKECDQNAGLKM